MGVPTRGRGMRVESVHFWIRVSRRKTRREIEELKQNLQHKHDICEHEMCDNEGCYTSCATTNFANTKCANTQFANKRSKHGAR